MKIGYIYDREFNSSFHSLYGYVFTAFMLLVAGILYGYDLELMVYTKNVDGTILRSDTEQLLMDLMIEHLSMDMSGFMSMSESYGFGSSMMTMGQTQLWQGMLPGTDGGLINPLLHKRSTSSLLWTMSPRQ